MMKGKSIAGQILTLLDVGVTSVSFGMLLFIVAGIGKCKIGGVIREILPMVLIMIGELFLLTYIPQIIMFIPNHVR